jgi:hypothetical protein
MNKILKKHLHYRVVSPSDNGHYFFGYYNLCPWSADGEKLLALRTTFADRFPLGTEPVKLGFLDANGSSFNVFGETLAWNFQQGAKLQWVSSPSGNLRIMHNDFRDGQLCSIMRDSNGVELGSFERPFYAISPLGSEAVGFSVARINSCRREYGYPVLPAHEASPSDSEDGIWKLNLTSGASELLVSIEQVKSVRPSLLGKNAKHYLIHAVYNKSGSRLLFLHRFEREDGITQTRLFTIGSDGCDLRLLMDGMVSHFDWYDDDTIFAWAGKRSMLSDGGSDGLKVRLKRSVMKCLKPIYYAMGKPRFLMVKLVGDSYHFIPDIEDSDIQPYMKGVFLTDGHCTFNDRVDTRWLLTDGYPNRNGQLPLYLCHMANEQTYEIGLFDCPRMYDGEIRVDLHPRFNRDFSQVCADVVIDGCRSMITMDVSSLAT